MSQWSATKFIIGVFVIELFWIFVVFQIFHRYHFTLCRLYILIYWFLSFDFFMLKWAFPISKNFKTQIVPRTCSIFLNRPINFFCWLLFLGHLSNLTFWYLNFMPQWFNSFLSLQFFLKLFLVFINLVIILFELLILLIGIVVRIVLFVFVDKWIISD